MLVEVIIQQFSQSCLMGMGLQYSELVSKVDYLKNNLELMTVLTLM